MRFRHVATLLLLLSSCAGGPHQAEVLTTPFPGTVLSARAAGVKCVPDGCPFVYEVRITNPTDRDANVQVCMLGTPRIPLPVQGVAGLWIQAHETKTVRAQFVLPLEKDAASDLVGRRASCTGLDWHGDPPI